MNLIDETVREKFYKWAKENEDRHIFPEISKEKETYYIARESEGTYMMEYSFKTVAEIRKALEEYSGLALEPQILRMLAAEVCQKRYDGGRTEAYKVNDVKESQKEENQNQETELPEFIYIF